MTDMDITSDVDVRVGVDLPESQSQGINIGVDIEPIREGRCGKCGGTLHPYTDDLGVKEDGLIGGDWGWCPVCRISMRTRGELAHVRVVLNNGELLWPAPVTGADE